jgi:hypothetical protein
MLPESIWLQTYLPILNQEMDKIGLTFNRFSPFVVMYDNTSRKKAKSLCEYYYLHIINSLDKKYND